jgi:hypothetical protein
MPVNDTQIHVHFRCELLVNKQAPHLLKQTILPQLVQLCLGGPH